MMHRLTLTTIAFVTVATGASAGDWPTYRADPARSGYSSEELPDRLSLRWTYRSSHWPMPAWPTRNRLRFDRCYQPVVAGGTLYFGSSADGKIYALDAASGRPRWTFFTDGPVRFAPTVWQDRIFVASDDGHLYCLAAADGKLCWKLRGGPRSEMLLGNDRMISRWPARGGPVVSDGVVYFASGIWPSEGIFVYAIDAASGKVLWCNDSSGTIEMDQPHSTARAKSGIAAQGYLAVGQDTLLVPTGRAVPAALDRRDGRLRYFRLQQNQHLGGSDVVAVGDCFAGGGALFAADSGDTLGRVGVEVAADPQWMVFAMDDRLVALDRQRLVEDKQVVDRKGNKSTAKVLTSPVWDIPVAFHAKAGSTGSDETRTPDNVMGSTAWSRPNLDRTASALIVVGKRVVAGGRGRVSIIDIGSGKATWNAEVEGTVYGLAAADGRLYVSTDQGVHHSFDAPGDDTPTTIRPAVKLPKGDDASAYAIAAEEIIRRTGVTEGYCLDLGCGDGRLSMELARRTKLRIYAVDREEANVQAARRRFDAAGLYGVRVTVHHEDSAVAAYPEHFADLVVSGRSIAARPPAETASIVGRLLCPGSGIACLGKPGAMETSVRGPLKGIGSWTHQNADTANSLCSADSLVRGPLEMLWFRDTDLVMPNRHGRAPGPLVHGGRMFVEGLGALRAQNIYNSRTLWEYPLPEIMRTYHREHSIGAAWTGGNYCVDDERVYIHDGRSCLCLDVNTGHKVAEFRPPLRPDGKPGIWGYIACNDGTLFGSLVNQDYLVKSWSDRWDTGGQFTESALLFALDARSGKQKWTYTAKDSIRHNAVAMGGGRIYLIDRPLARFDDVGLSEADARARARRAAATGSRGEDEEFRRLTEQPLGTLLALDQKTGEVLWRTDDDVFGTMLAYSVQHDVLLMAYQAVHQASRDSESGNRMAAYRAADATRLWFAAADYADRPVLVGRTVYAPPGAWDLLTGKPLPFELQRSYGCGIVAGAERLLVFRSATLGYCDLAGSQRVENYGGIRPGCWIAAVPAGGLVLMADAASWCTCSYLNQATIALKPHAPRAVEDSTGRDRRN